MRVNGIMGGKNTCNIGNLSRKRTLRVNQFDFMLTNSGYLLDELSSYLILSVPLDSVSVYLDKRRLTITIAFHAWKNSKIDLFRNRYHSVNIG